MKVVEIIFISQRIMLVKSCLCKILLGYYCPIIDRTLFIVATVRNYKVWIGANNLAQWMIIIPRPTRQIELCPIFETFQFPGQTAWCNILRAYHTHVHVYLAMHFSVYTSIQADSLSHCFAASRAGHFRYIWTFSIIKNDCIAFFFQINNLFLRQSYLKSPLPVKLTW